MVIYVNSNELHEELVNIPEDESIDEIILDGGMMIINVFEITYGEIEFHTKDLTLEYPVRLKFRKAWNNVHILLEYIPEQPIKLELDNYWIQITGVSEFKETDPTLTTEPEEVLKN